MSGIDRTFAAGFSIAATAKRNDRRILAIVMGSSVRQVRDAKAREMIEFGFANLPSIDVAPEVVETAVEPPEEPEPVVETKPEPVQARSR